jgi:serine protease Do
MILGIVIASFVGGALFRPLSRKVAPGGSASSRNLQSRVGVNNITTIENNGGAMIESVTPPDSPFDKAGIVGGDIITSFDGKQIKNEKDLRSAITSTLVGKTVEVIYTRDGETKKTNVTTVNEDELDRLNDVFDDRQKGRLGIDDTERVPVPNTNIYGVRVGQVDENRAAYFADMKEGDIVIEFNGTPIRTEEELNSRIYRATPRSTVKVVIMRDGQKVELNVKMGVR